MNKNSSNQRLPRAKGIDMGTYYTPKECARKVKHLVLPQMNRKIVEEFITILGMHATFEEHNVPIPNKVVMYGPPGTGKTLTAFYMAQMLELPLILVRLDAVIHSHLGRPAAISAKYSNMPKQHLASSSSMNLMRLQEHGRAMMRSKRWHAQ